MGSPVQPRLPGAAAPLGSVERQLLGWALAFQVDHLVERGARGRRIWRGRRERGPRVPPAVPLVAWSQVHAEIVPPTVGRAERARPIPPARRRTRYCPGSGSLRASVPAEDGRQQVRAVGQLAWTFPRRRSSPRLRRVRRADVLGAARAGARRRPIQLTGTVPLTPVAPHTKFTYALPPVSLEALAVACVVAMDGVQVPSTQLSGDRERGRVRAVLELGAGSGRAWPTSTTRAPMLHSNTFRRRSGPRTEDAEAAPRPPSSHWPGSHAGQGGPPCPEDQVSHGMTPVALSVIDDPKLEPNMLAIAATGVTNLNSAALPRDFRPYDFRRRPRRTGQEVSTLTLTGLSPVAAAWVPADHYRSAFRARRAPCTLARRPESEFSIDAFSARPRIDDAERRGRAAPAAAARIRPPAAPRSSTAYSCLVRGALSTTTLRCGGSWANFIHRRGGRKPSPGRGSGLAARQLGVDLGEDVPDGPS